MKECVFQQEDGKCGLCVREQAALSPLYTTQEVQKYLKISRPTLLKYIKEGRLKAFYAGKRLLILESELVAFTQGIKGGR